MALLSPSDICHEVSEECKRLGVKLISVSAQLLDGSWRIKILPTEGAPLEIRTKDPRFIQSLMRIMIDVRRNKQGASDGHIPCNCPLDQVLLHGCKVKGHV